LNETLLKIIEVDKAARKQAGDALEAEHAALESIGAERQKIIDLRLEEARRTAEDTKRSVLAKADKKAAQLTEKYAKAQAALDEDFARHREQWVSEIFARTLEQA